MTDFANLPGLFEVLNFPLEYYRSAEDRQNEFLDDKDFNTLSFEEIIKNTEKLGKEHSDISAKDNDIIYQFLYNRVLTFREVILQSPMKYYARHNVPDVAPAFVSTKISMEGLGHKIRIRDVFDGCFNLFFTDEFVLSDIFLDMDKTTEDTLVLNVTGIVN